MSRITTKLGTVASTVTFALAFSAICVGSAVAPAGAIPTASAITIAA